MQFISSSSMVRFFLFVSSALRESFILILFSVLFLQSLLNRELRDSATVLLHSSYSGEGVRSSCNQKRCITETDILREAEVLLRKLRYSKERVWVFLKKRRTENSESWRQQKEEWVPHADDFVISCCCITAANEREASNREMLTKTGAKDTQATSWSRKTRRVTETKDSSSPRLWLLDSHRAAVDVSSMS